MTPMMREIHIFLEEPELKKADKVKAEFDLTWKDLLMDSIERHTDLLKQKK